MVMPIHDSLWLLKRDSGAYQALLRAAKAFEE